jgi:hypothetical protein
MCDVRHRTEHCACRRCHPLRTIISTLLQHTRQPSRGVCARTRAAAPQARPSGAARPPTALRPAPGACPTSARAARSAACRGAGAPSPSRPGDGARTELAEFPRFRSAENECVDAPGCASGCERARESGVGGEARPRGEEKDEPRERERDGRSTFDEGGDASAMGAGVGVADGEGVCAGLSGDEVLPVIVVAESDDAIDGGGRGRSGLALIVYMLCDGRVVKLCRQRRRWAGGPSTLRAPSFAQSTGTWPVQTRTAPVAPGASSRLPGRGGGAAQGHRRRQWSHHAQPQVLLVFCIHRRHDMCGLGSITSRAQ